MRIANYWRINEYKGKKLINSIHMIRKIQIFSTEKNQLIYVYFVPDKYTYCIIVYILRGHYI